MNLLILGGTVFLGRHVVEAALTAGHSVTMLTRGLTQPELFPQVARVHADRDGGLDALPSLPWDAVIDTCGFVPRVVAQSCALPCRRYVFVSSVSAYADLSGSNDEDAALAPPVDSEDVALHYGALKAACEAVVLGLPNSVVVRPGLIGGPHDPTGRFTYWPSRLAEGGDVLAPGSPTAPVQVIDVRDLATWIVRMAAQGPAGVYNAVGHTLSMRATLETIRTAVGGDARLIWAPDLPEVAPWSELPLWVGDDPARAGLAQTPNGRARGAGLLLRPLAETARDTLSWARSLTGDPPRQVDGRYQPRTLTREREAELLRGTLPPLHAFFDPSSSPEALADLPESHGEITRAEAWRVYGNLARSERGGLHDERVFGPLYADRCRCGALSGAEHRGSRCDRCTVEVGDPALRSSRWGHIASAAGVAHPVLVRAAWRALGWSDEEGQRRLRLYATEDEWDGVDPIADLEAKAGHSVRVSRIPVPPPGSRAPVIPPDALDPIPCAFDRALANVVRAVRRLEQAVERDTPPIIQVHESIAAFERLDALMHVRRFDVPWVGPVVGPAPRLAAMAPRYNIDSFSLGRIAGGPIVRSMAFWRDQHLVVQRATGTEIRHAATGARLASYPHGHARLLGIVGDVAVYDEVLVERLNTPSLEPRPEARRRYERSRGLGALDLLSGAWLSSLPHHLWVRFDQDQPEDAWLEDVATGRSQPMDLDSDRPAFGGYAPGLTHMLAIGDQRVPIIDGNTGFPTVDVGTVWRGGGHRIEWTGRRRDVVYDDALPVALARTPEGMWRVFSHGDFMELDGARREVVWRLRGRATAAAMSPEAALLAVARGTGIRVLDATGRTVAAWTL